MSHFQGDTSLAIEPSLNPFYSPLKVGHFLKPADKGVDFSVLAKLNEKLQKVSGEAFAVQCWVGEELHRIPKSILNSLAKCYAAVFNESWGENWTTESAMQEVKKCIAAQPGYVPILSTLFHNEDVVGFCWGFIMETDALTDDSAPFSSSSVKRHESVEVARYWLNSVGNKNQLMSIRELGVLKEFRQEKAPFLTIPIFEKALSVNCNVAFFRTKTTSTAFKWSLGVGFVPLQLFIVDAE
jgi:hypothetical protein